MLEQLARPAATSSAIEIAYGIIRRVGYDPQFLTALLQKPDDVIRSCGITDPAGILEIKGIVSVLGRGIQANTEMAEFAKRQYESTAATADAFKSALRKTIEQIDAGFQSTMTMSKVAFYLGVFLILASGVFAAMTQKALLSIIFAGVGAADIIGFFITNPPKDIQRSRANLAQLQAALFNWFTDTCNLNGYLGTLNGAPGDVFPRFKEVSETLLNNTERMMGLIDKYCEVGKTPEKAG